MPSPIAAYLRLQNQSLPSLTPPGAMMTSQPQHFYSGLSRVTRVLDYSLRELRVGELLGWISSGFYLVRDLDCSPFSRLAATLIPVSADNSGGALPNNKECTQPTHA